VVPKDLLIFAAVAGFRRDLSVACDEAARANDGIVRFDELATAMTDGIVVMGGALNELFRLLTIRPHVPVVSLEWPVLEEGDEMLDVVLVDSTMPRALDSCERLQTRLKSIQTALADTSMLFKNKQ
jgi:hypothetical protein